MAESLGCGDRHLCDSTGSDTGVLSRNIYRTVWAVEPVEAIDSTEGVLLQADNLIIQYGLGTGTADVLPPLLETPKFLPIPQHTSVKPYMDYRAVTDTASRQWELLQGAYHADNGLMYVDGHLCVALGSQFGEVGTRYTFTMSTGEIMGVIKCDQKQDAHTLNGEGWLGTNGHLMEMIVDTDLLDSEAMYMGDCDCLVSGTVETVQIKE